MTSPTMILSMSDALDAKKQSEEDKIQDLIYGTFFRVDGKIRVVGQPHYCNYYPEDGGQPNIIWNTTVIEQAGMPFVAGTRQGQTEPEVLWIDKSRLVDDRRIATPYAQHAGGHQYGSLDPLWVDPRQITDLRIYPTLGQLKVNVAPGAYGHLGRHAYFVGEKNYDLSDDQPTAGTKRAVGLYLDGSNELQSIAGTVVARPVLPIPEPEFPKSSFQIGIVIIYGSGDQDYVDWEDCKNRKILYGHDGPTILQMQVFS